MLLERITPTYEVLVSECAGSGCSPMPPLQLSVDVTVALTPGRYIFSAKAFVLTLTTGDKVSEWDLTVTSPPAVPLAPFVGPAMAASLAALGAAALRRQEPGRSC